MSRTSLIHKNIAASVFLKGWGAAIVFLMVPLTLKMLGKYNNGVWLTISSMMMWIDMLDIGLGSGLRNAVAEYMAKDDLKSVRTAISSTLVMLMLISIPVIIVIAVIIYLGDIYGALSIDPHQTANLQSILIVAAVFMCSTFVFKTIGNVYMGLQLPAVSNLLMVLGQTFALLLTFVAYKLGSHSLMHVVVINTLAPLIVWMLAYPFTFWRRYSAIRPSLSCFDMKMAKSMCTTGAEFFVLQICGVILFMSTNIIISKIFSPAEVTPYQVAYRYYTIVLVFFTIVCMPFWNATTDAYTKGDLEWIRGASRKMNRMMILIAILMIVMTAVSIPVYRIWTDNEVEIPMSISIAMACYMFVIILSQRYSYFLNGIGALKIQMVFTVTATVIFLPLANLACNYYPTVTALIVVMCLVNIPGLIANIWKFNRVIIKK